ncbi:zf-HC2 domain-containing protein [Nocardiopsis ansamitocini]|uniref:Putative zinc-finger domain-containing protein n=1 Tax=Nocardiopsis ansamitocini TaxID=1670832 RepID=A0A9W6UI30_9ACTN|nr:zf-HC2 domain-containing protein [Nocardiopsis ansamitocini]GLU46983.1 hypothetical protein Nans01_13340 [Nocardiopsis ansamitocini]
MSCLDCRTALSAELDGEEPGHSPHAVRVHLHTCEHCGTWLSAARGLQRLVGELMGARYQDGENRMPDRIGQGARG